MPIEPADDDLLLIGARKPGLLEQEVFELAKAALELPTVARTAWFRHVASAMHACNTSLGHLGEPGGKLN